jgi:hypothetical protein
LKKSILHVEWCGVHPIPMDAAMFASTSCLQVIALGGICNVPRWWVVCVRLPAAHGSHVSNVAEGSSQPLCDS